MCASECVSNNNFNNDVRWEKQTRIRIQCRITQKIDELEDMKQQ